MFFRKKGKYIAFFFFDEILKFSLLNQYTFVCSSFLKLKINRKLRKSSNFYLKI